MRPNIYGAPPTNEEAAPDEMQACMHLPDHRGTDPIFRMLHSIILYLKLPSTSVVSANPNIIIFDTQSVSARSLITRQERVSHFLQFLHADPLPPSAAAATLVWFPTLPQIPKIKQETKKSGMGVRGGRKRVSIGVLT